MIESFVELAPQPMLGFCSRMFGLPLRPEVLAAGIIFIHVPKNAGTTVARQLYGLHIGHRTARFYKAADPKFFAQAPSFALTRDPVARFRSAYEFTRSGGTLEVPVSRGAQAFAERFPTAAACAAHIAGLSEAARRKLDFVFRRQSDFICDEAGAVMVNRLFRLEDVSGGHIEVAGRKFELSKRVNARQAAAVLPDARLTKAVRLGYARDFDLWELGTTGGIT